MHPDSTRAGSSPSSWARRWISRGLALFLHLLYTRLAWVYDGVAWLASAGAWQAWVNEACTWISGPRVLELGPGPGHLQTALHAQPALHVYGLELSRAMLRVSLRNLARADAARGQRLVQGRAQRLPYPANCFDCLVATFPTPYIFAAETLAEIQRVLCPHGRLVVILAAHPAPQHPLGWLANRLLALVGPPGEDQQAAAAICAALAQYGLAAELRWESTRHGPLWLLRAEVQK
jgi:SAM-dependent methyltransferase